MRSAGTSDSLEGSACPGPAQPQGCFADLVALGRSLIADPDWPRKLAEGRDEEIVGCLRDSIHRGLPIRCIHNPEVGSEHEAPARLVK
jgi:hypothetical protein